MFISVVDPGFPVGRGADLVGGSPMSEASAIWRKRMSERNNWLRLGGRPLDPPMQFERLAGTKP